MAGVAARDHDFTGTAGVDPSEITTPGSPVRAAVAHGRRAVYVDGGRQGRSKQRLLELIEMVAVSNRRRYVALREAAASGAG
jgi:hypothetical protein